MANIKQKQVVISDEIYDVFMSEIMAMKPSKRKNWKGYCVDKLGVKTKARFKNDQLENYCYRVKAWVKLARFTDHPSDEGEPTSIWGQMVSDGVSLDVVVTCAMILNHTGKADGRARKVKVTKTYTTHTSP